MTPESISAPATRPPGDKPFPWRCGVCRKKAVWPATIAEHRQIRLDGQLHTIDVPNMVVPRCRECGELHYDNHAAEQFSRTVRVHLHLLMPEQIQANRDALRLSMPELAARLGVEIELLVDWERGIRFQSRSQDNLMRAFFALSEVRSALCGPSQDPTFGAAIGTSDQPTVS